MSSKQGARTIVLTEREVVNDFPSFYARVANTNILRSIRNSLEASDVQRLPNNLDEYQDLRAVNAFTESERVQNDASVRTVALPGAISSAQAEAIEQQLSHPQRSYQHSLQVQNNIGQSINMDPGAREWTSTAVWRSTDSREFIQNERLNLGSDENYGDYSKLKLARAKMQVFGMSDGVIQWKHIWADSSGDASYVNEHIGRWLKSECMSDPQQPGEIDELWCLFDLIKGIAHKRSLGDDIAFDTSPIDSGFVSDWFFSENTYDQSQLCLIVYEDGTDPIDDFDPYRLDIKYEEGSESKNVYTLAHSIHEEWVTQYSVSAPIEIEEYYTKVLGGIVFSGTQEDAQAKIQKYTTMDKSGRDGINHAVENMTILSFIITNLSVRISTWLDVLDTADTPKYASTSSDETTSIINIPASVSDEEGKPMMINVQCTSRLGVYTSMASKITDKLSSVLKSDENGCVTSVQILAMMLYRDYLMSAMLQTRAAINCQISGQKVLHKSDMALNDVSYSDFIAAASVLFGVNNGLFEGSSSRARTAERLISANVNRSIMQLGMQGAALSSFIYNLPTNKDAQPAVIKYDATERARRVLGDEFIAYEKLNSLANDGKNIAVCVESCYRNLLAEGRFGHSHFIKRVIERGMFMGVTNMLQMTWMCGQEGALISSYQNLRLGTSDAINEVQLETKELDVPDYFQQSTTSKCTRDLAGDGGVIVRTIKYGKTSLSQGELGSSAINGIHGLNGPVVMDVLVNEDGHMAASIAKLPLSAVLAPETATVRAKVDANICVIVGYPLAALAIKGDVPCVQLDGTQAEVNGTSVVSRFEDDAFAESHVNEAYKRYNVTTDVGAITKLPIGESKRLSGKPYGKTAVGNWEGSGNDILLTVPPASIDTLLARYANYKELEMSKGQSSALKTFEEWLKCNPEQISLKGVNNASYVDFLISNLPTMMYGMGISAIDMPINDGGTQYTYLPGYDEDKGEIKMFKFEYPDDEMTITLSDGRKIPVFMLLADDTLRAEAIETLRASDDDKSQEVMQLLEDVPKLWTDVVLRYSGYTVPFVKRFLEYMKTNKENVEAFVTRAKTIMITKISSDVSQLVTKYAKVPADVDIATDKVDQLVGNFIDYMISKNFIALRENVESHNKLYSRESLTCFGVDNAIMWVRMYLGSMSTLVTVTDELAKRMKVIKRDFNGTMTSYYDPSTLDTVLLGRADVQPARRNLKAHLQPSTLTKQGEKVGWEIRVSGNTDILESLNTNKMGGEFRSIFNDMGRGSDANSKIKAVQDLIHNPKTSHIKYTKPHSLLVNGEPLIVDKSMITCGGKSVLNLQRLLTVKDTISSKFGGLIGDQIVHITPRGVQLTCDDVFRAMASQLMTAPTQQILGKLFYLRMDSITFHIGVTVKDGVRCYFEAAGRFSRLAKRLSYNGIVGVTKHSADSSLGKNKGGPLSIFR